MLAYTIVENEDGSSVVVFVPGSTPLVAADDHPHYAEIIDGARNGDESIVSLFDISETAAAEFLRISERVTSADGRLYFDGDEVDSSLAEHVVRVMETDGETSGSFRAILAFFENVQENPNEHSRTMLYDWLRADSFSITEDGLLVGYKGVRRLEDGSLVSVNTGRAIVDGVVHEGAIPNGLGSIVEMPRSEVQHNPSVGCSVGLHVGTFDYASDWAKGAVLEVHVHPRDVVSVPSDCSAAKLRTCRYRVVGVLASRYAIPVLAGTFGDADGWTDGD